MKEVVATRAYAVGGPALAIQVDPRSLWNLPMPFTQVPLLTARQFEAASSSRGLSVDALLLEQLHQE